MEKITEDINHVLADWDPIGVNQNIASDEYRSYIPLILKVINDEQKLLNCLEDVLINKMEIGYNPKNEEHVADLQAVCRRIIRVYEKAKT